MFDLSKNKIFLDFSGELKNISMKFYEAEKNKKNLTLTKKEEFIFDLFQKLNEIAEKINDLELSIKFISIFPACKSWGKEVTREKYIIYHLEYYYINIVALFDRLLHLINFLYDLGLSDRFVTLNCITSNFHVEKKVVTTIKNIDKKLQGIRSTQNKIKHKTKLKIKELYTASLLEFYLTLKNELSKEDKKYWRADMNYHYRDFIKTKKKELENNNIFIKTSVEILLDKLFNQYKKIKTQKK